MESVFDAGVQYDDFKGEVAADGADTVSLKDFLVSIGKCEANDVLLGLRFSFTENQGDPQPNLGFVAYLGDGTEDSSIKAVEFEMNSAEIFKYFKRFDLVMTRHGDKFEGREVDGPHWE